MLVGGLGAIPGTSEHVQTLFLIMLLVMIVGPGVASILLTSLLYGKAGLREVLSRLFRWRVGAGWYAVALLTVPLLFTAVLLGLLLTSPEFLLRTLTSDEKATVLLIGIVGGLATGFLGEL